MMFILGLLATAAVVLIMALMLDGILPRAPLERLVNFPLKGAPATNGVIFAAACGFALFAVRVAF